MIIFVQILLSELSGLGKNFNWEIYKINCCPRCNSKLWGHGYVSRYFSGFSSILYLKRYRCPNCGLVITIRPIDHWSRYRTSIINIFQALIFRIRHCVWPPEITRQRGGHWLRKLVKKVKMDFGLSDKMGLAQRLEYLYNKNINFLV